MKKSEQRALEAYPHYTAENFDEVMKARKFFAKGYSQAEKDLALTAEDIKQIILIHYDIVFKDETGVRCGDVAEEVLRRFNAMKEEKK